MTSGSKSMVKGCDAVEVDRPIFLLGLLHNGGTQQEDPKADNRKDTLHPRETVVKKNAWSMQGHSKIFQ